MRKVLPDTTNAVVDTNYVADSNAGTVYGTQQKKLVDSADSSEANDGEPSSFTLTPDEAKKFFEGAGSLLQQILDSRTPEAPATQPETTPAAEGDGATN